MVRSGNRLTKRSVESAKPKSEQYFLWDSEVRGFGLCVKPSGHKSYVIQYRPIGRPNARRHAIGTHGVYTVETARERASKLLRGVREGRDPAEEKEAAKRAATFKELGERYLTEYARPKKRPSSVKADERNLRLHVYPELGSRRAVDIKRADILDLHHKMKGTPGAANRVLALLSKMFNLAEAWGIRPDGSNPCRHVERYPERKMERFLSDDELARLGKALGEAERTQSVSRLAAAAIRLLLFTGCRLSEITGLRRDEIDQERGCLRLGDDRSKTGAKVVHLNAPALQVLAGIKPVKDNPYVFVGRSKGPLSNLRRPWLEIRKAAKLGDVRLHDLRHSFASVGVAGGLSLPITGKLLGHSQAATTQRYAHLAADPLKQAADMIGRRILAAMAGPKGNVVEIAARKVGKRNRRG